VNHCTGARPGESIELSQTIYAPAPTPGSLAHRQQQLRKELRNSLRSPQLSTMNEGGTAGGATGPGAPLKRLSLDKTAMHAVLKKKRKMPSQSRAVMNLTRYYCSKCRTNDAEHSYENCPTWRHCGFCDKIGHWGFHCETPHIKCTQNRCSIHVGHRHIRDVYPWSKEVKQQNFRYACEGQIVDLAHACSIYGEGLDWDSYGQHM
jgi:hypothetical protein